MKIFNPKDTRMNIQEKIHIANVLEDDNILSSWNFVHFLNTGRLGIYDSTRFYIKSLFKGWF